MRRASDCAGEHPSLRLPATVENEWTPYSAECSLTLPTHPRRMWPVEGPHAFKFHNAPTARAIRIYIYKNVQVHMIHICLYFGATWRCHLC